ncbi:MAG: MalY/PatB family protein [Anaerosacchariphilus sp.]
MNFDEYIERRGTESYKWDGYHPEFPEVPETQELLPLWVADMDFKCPQPVIDAVTKRAELGIYGYSVTNSDGFVEAACTWVKRRYHYNIEKEWIVYTRGIIPGYNIAIQAFTNPGDGVLIQRPVYSPYTDSIVTNGREVVDSPLKRVNGHYEIDFEDFEVKAARPNTKLMIMSNPHNPIGRVWTEEELQKIGEICVKHHVIIVSDEVHADLIMKGYRHVPIASLSKEIADITISAYAPSKTFNMAGLQTSYFVISNPFLRADFVGQQARNRIWDINFFGSAALQAAYTECDEWLDELLIYLEDNMDFMKEYLESHIPKLKMNKPEGTYLVWVDFTGTGLSGEQLQKKMLEEAKIAVDFGDWFGDGYELFARFNVACPRNILQEALHRLEKVFK